MSDHDRYPFRLTYDRDPIEWPNGAKLAFYVGINIEFIHFDREAPGTMRPDINANDFREYGARVCLPRMMDILDKHQTRASVLLNSDVCIYQPQIIEEGNKRGWEWLGHGLTNGKNMNAYPPEQEQAAIREVRDTITRLSGQTPRGWLGPGLAETFKTPDFLAAEGFEYCCDWSGDDQPLPMRVDSGKMISMPYHNGVNDARLIGRFDFTGPEYYQAVCDQFDVLYEAAMSGGGLVMALPTHPHQIGFPFRIKYFDKAIEYILSHDKVWNTTSGEISQWYYDHYYKTPTMQSAGVAV